MNLYDQGSCIFVKTWTEGMFVIMVLMGTSDHGKMCMKLLNNASLLLHQTIYNNKASYTVEECTAQLIT